MSMFSGTCDLCDHIAGLGGWYDRDGNKVKFGNGNGPYYSDEYLDFLEFKKRTGGVLHQHKRVTVTEYNLKDVEARLNGRLRVIERRQDEAEKRSETGRRRSVKRTYEYFGTEYKTLKELNKHGVYVSVDIHFNTLLDLLPYYPYIVSMAACSDGVETVYISGESYVTSERDDHYRFGHFGDFWETYAKRLQDHYREIVLLYYNPEGREVVEEIEFDEEGLGKASHPIDDGFDLEWRWADGKSHAHWTSPKLVDADKGEILMHSNDIERFGRKMLVYYVKKTEHKLHL